MMLIDRDFELKARDEFTTEDSVTIKLRYRAKNFFFIPLVHWTSKIQILVVRKLISLVQKNLLK